MRLWINSNTPVPERAIVHGILAGEQVLAAAGVTLPDCLQAFAADARKEPPLPALAIFEAAEKVALRVAFAGRQRASHATLTLVLSPGDAMPDLPLHEPGENTVTSAARKQARPC